MAAGDANGSEIAVAPTELIPHGRAKNHDLETVGLGFLLTKRGGFTIWSRRKFPFANSTSIATLHRSSLLMRVASRTAVPRA